MCVKPLTVHSIKIIKGVNTGAENARPFFGLKNFDQKNQQPISEKPEQTLFFFF